MLSRLILTQYVIYFFLQKIDKEFSLFVSFLTLFLWKNIKERSQITISKFFHIKREGDSFFFVKSTKEKMKITIDIAPIIAFLFPFLMRFAEELGRFLLRSQGGVFSFLQWHKSYNCFCGPRIVDWYIIN